MKIRPPSACNPARFARHCLARVTRELSVRLLARERCGIRTRCVRVLDARSFARGGRRVRSCVRSFVRVRRREWYRARSTARRTLVVVGASASTRWTKEEEDEEDEDEEGVRSSRDDEARRTTRGDETTTTRTRRRGDEGTRLATRRVRGRDDARVHRCKRLHAFIHACIRIECVRWRFFRNEIFEI